MNSHAGSPSNRLGIAPSSSVLLLSRLNDAHQKMDSCLQELECLTSGTEPCDTAVAAARMRIGKANFERRRVVQEVCVHIMRVASPHEVEAVRELQTGEMEMLRLISLHIQRWTSLRVRDDWVGYCGAFRSLGTRVRDVVMKEKGLLHPLLERS